MHKIIQKYKQGHDKNKLKQNTTYSQTSKYIFTSAANVVEIAMSNK